jgi:xylan 1,4-beta-xylosidase
MTMRFFLAAVLSIYFSIQVFSQVPGDTLKIADPSIFVHNNKFYLYGTVERNAGKGFLVHVSDDLKTWKLSTENSGYALKKGDVFGRSGFWAPQVFTYKNKFYMAYTANEQIAIAESDSPLGPFVQEKKDSLACVGKQIDPFVFFDDDGKKYLYHVRLIRGNRIFVAEMHDDLSGIKPETLKECVTAGEGWENTKAASWPVTEGPTVVKRGSVYYLFYSANDFRNPDYAVGYATSDSPFGPWKKHPGNPVLVRTLLGIPGTGHGDLLRVREQWYYVFHTHGSDSRPGPRKTALVKAHFIKGKPETFAVDRKTFSFLVLEND